MTDSMNSSATSRRSCSQQPCVSEYTRTASVFEDAYIFDFVIERSRGIYSLEHLLQLQHT